MYIYIIVRTQNLMLTVKCKILRYYDFENNVLERRFIVIVVGIYREELFAVL